MELELIISFLGASILLSVMPGPDNIYVLTESITKGYKTGVWISLGLVLGVLFHTMLAATGLSLIIKQSTIIFTIIKYLGASYLFYLAHDSFKEEKPDLKLDSKKGMKRVKIMSLVKKGLLMNTLNPKVSLFFIAFLPLFISDGVNASVQFFVLGIIFMLQAFLVFSCIALLSGQLTQYVAHPKFWVISKYTKVVVLSVLGIALLLAEK